MPSSMRSKDYSGNKTHLQAPMSERQQMALLMQMTSAAETHPKSPGGTSYSMSRHRDRNERGETPLHLAAIKGDEEQIAKLLSQKADPNVTDFAGWTPLHEACNHGWFEVANKLVQAGANVNAKGLDNDTPLHDAVLNGHLNIIKLLVEHGADFNSKNAKGKSPMDLASSAIKPYLLNSNLPIPESMVPARLPSRGRDEKKVTEGSKTKSNNAEENMDTNKNEDVYEFKSSKDQVDQKSGQSTETDDFNSNAATFEQPSTDESAKRNFSELNDNGDENTNEEESRKKKRKDEGGKEKSAVRGAAQSKGQAGKNVAAFDSTSTEENTKRNSSESNENPDETANEEESRKKKRKDEGNKEKNPPRGAAQNKGQTNKPSTSNATKGSNLNVNKTGADKKSPCPSPKVSSDAEDDSKTDLKVPPLKIVIPQTSTNEQEVGVTRSSKSSSQRAHQALPYVVPSSNNSDSNDKESDNASNPEDSSQKSDEKKEAGAAATTDDQTNAENETPSTSTPSTSTATVTPASVDLHPRKRKMKPNKEPPTVQADAPDAPAESQIHPHEQPITNCYQLYLDIRKQIEKRRKGLFPVQPKPPQGFTNYLMVRGNYVLAGKKHAPVLNVIYPPTLPAQMTDIFKEQETERFRLKMQHVIEKEKLVLSVEQEILRVHGRAARALANQSLPFSVCSILRDEEVYNLITPEQEEKDRNARSRYNGRLFLSWLQDVDDKWEKIKEHMLLRHHNEAESLHAVQKMDWEWKMKELSLCDRKSTPSIDEHHVPMVIVSDDFDLLPP